MLRQHSDNTQYCLSIPKTTIGSRDCELIVQGPEVAPQHLQIEKRNGTSEYVLHDLGTSEGTFVNHCRVSGASVKLNCGDIIKLGLNSPAYTFITPQAPPNTKHSEILTPSIVGTDPRPSSAPLSKSENVAVPTVGVTPRNNSAILTGRSTMKRNVLNGIMGSTVQGSSTSQHPDKADLLDILQQTVCAQEDKLKCLTEDMRHIKTIEHQGSRHSQTISVLERELEELRKGKVHTLQKLEQQKSETQSANHVLASLQGELMGKSEAELKLQREIELLNKDKKDQAGSVRFSPVVSLRRQLAEKDAELRHIKSEYNAYKVRPDELKEQNIIFAKENKNLRKQVRDRTRQAQEHQDKVVHLEKDLSELQSKLQHETRMHITARDMVARLQTEVGDKAKLERMLKIECKEAEAQLKLFEASVREALSKLEQEAETEEVKTSLIGNLNEFVKSHLGMSKTLDKREEELATSRKGHASIHENLTKLEIESLDLLELVQTEGEISGKVEKEGNKIASLDISENLKWLQGMILTLTRSVQKYSCEVESKSKLADLAAKATGLSPGAGVGRIIEDLKDTALRLRKEKEQTQEKLTNTIDDYEARLAAQHTKLTTNVAQELQSLKRLHEEQMRALYVSEQQKQNEMVCEYTAQTNHLKHKLAEFHNTAERNKQEVGDALKEKCELETQITDLQNAAKTDKMIEESLREKIAKFDEDSSSLRQSNIDRDEKLRALTDEAEALREQNRQYAITIVTMENKLYSMNTRCTNMETDLNSSLSKLEAIPAPPPEPYEVLKCREGEMKREIHRLNTLSSTLRREYGLAKAEADQRGVQIQGLRCDLAGAAARLSDMSGELSESQKIAMENSRDKIQEQEAQISVQKETIGLLTAEVDRLHKKLANLPDRIPAPKKSPAKVKIEYKERELTEEERENIEVGRKCIEERHSLIIDKQRLALAEFREQLKSRNPQAVDIMDAAQGTEHVLRLKKELKELRAALRNKDSEYAGKEEHLKTKLNSCTEKNLDVLKQTKAELSDSQRLLGHSEACFSALVTELRSVLHQPHSPVAALAVNKLEQALKERAFLTADLGAQISAVTTRLSQKDVLLSTYQDDLSHLRNSELEGECASLLKKKMSVLEEESGALRKSLSHLQGELDQQQRLNNALVQRQAVREVSSEPHLQHHCADPRTQDQISLLKKQHQEEIKRKNYDIKKLKEVLDAS